MGGPYSIMLWSSDDIGGSIVGLVLVLVLRNDDKSPSCPCSLQSRFSEKSCLDLFNLLTLVAQIRDYIVWPKMKKTVLGGTLALLTNTLSRHSWKKAPQLF
jgi:hypothetical protein